jgi:hypothetical protein
MKIKCSCGKSGEPIGHADCGSKETVIVCPQCRALYLVVDNPKFIMPRLYKLARTKAAVYEIGGEKPDGKN